MFIFSIKNEKLNFFNRPIYAESSNEACSYIQNVLMSDADRALLGLKDDLSLYFIGEIDFKTGIISPSTDVYGDDSDYSIASSPKFVCSLKEIFDTIPAGKLKPTLTRDDIVSVHEKLSELQATIGELNSKFKTHKHGKRGVVYDS